MKAGAEKQGGSTPASTYRFTEIGQTSYNKYIFDEKKTFQAEIWKKKV